ncbi:MAG: hypothetical protein ACXABY_16935 [Candidatus Thorarchaeota archaeon]
MMSEPTSPKKDDLKVVYQEENKAIQEDTDSNVEFSEVEADFIKVDETEEYKLFQDRLKKAFVSNEDYHLFNKLPLSDKQKVELILDMLVKEDTSKDELETTSNEFECDGDVCRLVKKKDV